jgi:4-nitrophenyl phosphatase/phosphoglycolate phosphatase
MIDYLAEKFGIQPSKIMIVGDRLDTDVLFGNNNGYRLCVPPAFSARTAL